MGFEPATTCLQVEHLNLLSHTVTSAICRHRVLFLSSAVRMAGRGRGRGRGQLTFNIEAVGIGKGENLPPSTLQPTPLFPVRILKLFVCFTAWQICLSCMPSRLHCVCEALMLGHFFPKAHGAQAGAPTDRRGGRVHVGPEAGA